MTTVRAPGTGTKTSRIALILVLVLVVLTTLSAYAVFQNRIERRSLDPDSPAPDGTRALATLLEDRGVDVSDVSTVDAAMDAGADGDVTIVVPFPYLLGADSVRRLTDLPSSVRVVFLQPDSLTLRALDINATSGSYDGTDTTTEPGCDLPEARSAGDVALTEATYRTDDDDLTRCYGGGLLAGDNLVLVGSAELFTNDMLAQDGNAALAIGLLNEHERVVWLMSRTPELDSSANQPSLSELLPGWVTPVFLLLVVAGVLSMFWRGRRLGPPVAEPLPVVVRSAEAVEGRARLYRAARARDVSFAALRAAALGRLLPVLGLGPSPEPRSVVAAVAERSGTTPAIVYALLYGPPPADDDRLVSAADAFDLLVRDTLDPAAPGRSTKEERPQ